jgi:AcrR family transcriptional regulator
VQFPESVIEPVLAGEPKVVTEDVRAILRMVIRPDEDDGGSVQMIAERADTSTRTVYRVLSEKHSKAISLDLADRLCLAAGSHVALCRLQWPDGTVSAYF